MVSDWILLFVLVILPFLFAFNGKRKKKHPPSNKLLFYLKDIVFSIILLFFFFALKPRVYHPPDFTALGKGVPIGEEVISAVVMLFLLPFFLSFTAWNNNYPKDLSAAKEIMGYPVCYLPNTAKEYFFFVCYILVGVLFEELVCRQLLFYSLNATLDFRGDTLVVLSSLLFAAGHLYQGWQGVLSNFVVGLLLGKVFLVQETLLYPIVLHLFLNLTIAVLAFRRIKDIRRINLTPQAPTL